MVDVADFIRRSAQRSGFKREFFLEKNMPNQPSNVLAIPFFGDIRSLAIFSTFVMRSYEELNKDKYIILCSWPGMHSLFPYFDEFWSIDDESAIKALASQANNVYNYSNLAADLTRGLSESLEILSPRNLEALYNKGFTKKYWSDFGEIKRYLPEVLSASRTPTVFKNQMEASNKTKILVYPAMKIRSWQNGETISLPVFKEFWTGLLKRLIDEGYLPVVNQNWFTYDMSKDFAEKCIYIVPNNANDMLAAYRYVGCVLDIHSGISRFATLARCPYLAVTERQTFIEEKDFEFDDLCAEGLPKQYIFSFSTMLMNGNEEDWESSIYDNIMARLKVFLPSLQKTKLPSTNESFDVVSYDKVRERKAKRLGVSFLNSSKKK